VGLDDDEAFVKLFRSEYPTMERLAYLMTGERDAARELAQEAFARAYASWGRVGGYDRPGAWVRRVLIRLAGRQRDRRAREFASADDAPTELPELEETSVMVRELVLQLPLKQRAAVVLTYYEGLPSAEVAEIIGCSDATVRVHLHKARRTLGERLAVDESDEESDVDR
jgi:RNA polymerase sigma-70 factor (ECF subfamily)